MSVCVFVCVPHVWSCMAWCSRGLNVSRCRFNWLGNITRALILVLEFRWCAAQEEVRRERTAGKTPRVLTHRLAVWPACNPSTTPHQPINQSINQVANLLHSICTMVLRKNKNKDVLCKMTSCFRCSYGGGTVHFSIFKCNGFIGDVYIPQKNVSVPALYFNLIWVIF